MDVEAKYQRLNKSEKDFLFWHPFAALAFNSNAETALKEAQRRFGDNTLHNGSGDAFRHCFWSAMNARDEGADLARLFGQAHEDFTGNPAAEKSMDLHNNDIGIAIGARYPGSTDRHLAVLCVQAWAGRKLVQIDAAGGSDLSYSNSTEKWLYEETP